MHHRKWSISLASVCSPAGGVGTIAKNDYQTVIGRYNANKNSAFIIGNGSSDTERSNALTVDWDGNITGKSLTSANDLKLGFGSSNIFKPYFTKGDSITLTINSVNPSSFRAAIVGSGCGVNIVATFGNTVNATVNDVCSITASIKITFS